MCDAQLIELPAGDSPEIDWADSPCSTRGYTVEDVQRTWSRKGLNHGGLNYTAIRYTVTQPRTMIRHDFAIDLRPQRWAARHRQDILPRAAR